MLVNGSVTTLTVLRSGSFNIAQTKAAKRESNTRSPVALWPDLLVGIVYGKTETSDLCSCSGYAVR